MTANFEFLEQTFDEQEAAIDRIQCLTESRGHYRIQYAALQNATEQLKAVLNFVENSFDTTQEEIVTAANSLKFLSEIRETQRREFAALREKYNDLAKRLELAQQENIRLMLENQSLKTQRNFLVNKKNRLIEELNEHPLERFKTWIGKFRGDSYQNNEDV